MAVFHMAVYIQQGSVGNWLIGLFYQLTNGIMWYVRYNISFFF